MIYAIHRETKEHRLLTGRRWRPGTDWLTVEADADGWIQHTGQGCPLPDGARYEVKNRDGEWGEGVVGKWVHGSYQREYDIIAYRPILDAEPAEPAEPEAPEWDGEGLPPVGVEVEVKHGLRWISATTVGAFGDHKKCMVCAPNGGGFFGFYPEEIRPIRTPAQRAEDAMFDLFNQHAEITPGKARTLAAWAAKAIRDGNIPGVKLEG